MDGFAAVVDGKIDLRTVSPTETAAMVNGIVVLFNGTVLRSQDDASIKSMWNDICEMCTNDVVIAPVTVSITRH